MYYTNHDEGLDFIKPRKKQVAYGMGLGIMLLEDVYPAYPGDVRNASAYPFPIQFDIIQGLDVDHLCLSDPTPFREEVIKTAKRLERMGVRAIIGECGYFAFFQKDVADAVDVPVFLSSLLQVPMAQRIVGLGNKVGIMCAFKNNLSPTHLKNVGVDLDSEEFNIVIAGAVDDYAVPELNRLWRTPERECNYKQCEKEFVGACVDFYQKNPDMKALVLECTGFPPFGRAVQRELDIPVFSWGTMLDYAYSVVVNRDYYGHC